MAEKKYFGVMLDNSRNAVMKPEQVKKFADYISAFGYNSLQLYTEDTYEVTGEPYFGYLRGRYTKEELKDLDKYCAGKGIELIPCIQTLAHLNQIFRWGEYQGIRDVGDILLADEDATYKLIDDMFATLAECFTSRRVNVGMDEAHMLGRGAYFDKHGPVNRFEILSRHLKKVIAIAAKYGFKCMMWSDMFIRMANNGEYYADKVNIPQEAIDGVPENVDLIYWDYYHTDKPTYDKMIAAHKKLVGGDRIWFGGGAWVWKGFAPDNAFTRRSMKPAMQSCHENGIDNVSITMWGDDGKECSFYSALPSLYYIKKIYDGETDMQTIKDGFGKIVGADYDALCSLDMPNQVQGGKKVNVNPCKYHLYGDPFCGFLDVTLRSGVNEEYASCARKLARQAKKAGEFGYIFDSLKALCDVLAIKAELGVKLRAAYKSGDKAKLADLAKDMKKLEKRLDAFYCAYRKLWYTENKPYGFEIQDARLGGLMRRVKSCRETVEGFVNGEIKEIPELSETLLPFGESGKPLCFNGYLYNVSVNVLSHGC